jgi:hypothetical protein
MAEPFRDRANGDSLASLADGNCFLPKLRAVLADTDPSYFHRKIAYSRRNQLGPSGHGPLSL